MDDQPSTDPSFPRYPSKFVHRVPKYVESLDCVSFCIYVQKNLCDQYKKYTDTEDLISPRHHQIITLQQELVINKITYFAILPINPQYTTQDTTTKNTSKLHNH